MHDPLHDAQRLIHQKHLSDGLPEIAIGIGLLTAAFFVGLQVVYRPASLPYREAALGMALILAPMCGAMPWAIKSLRRRYFTEKIGYVELKPTPPKLRMAAGAVALVVSAVMVWAIARGSVPPRSWLLIVEGSSGGVLAVYCGRLRRYVIGGALMAALGFALGFCRVSLEMGSLILYGSMGALSLLSGLIVFVRFLGKPVEVISE
jgi:hypothetical protein